MSESGPRRTALYEAHVALGARFTEFGGWDMPVRYGSIIDEHRAVRGAAGLFDLSHMGELRVSGPDAGAGLAHALVNDPRRLAPGRAGYSLLCQPDGGVIDDLIVYRLTEDRYLVVPNASNREVVADELRSRLADMAAELTDETLETSLVAIQGPAAAAIVGRLTGHPLERSATTAWPRRPSRARRCCWPGRATRAKTASSSSAPRMRLRRCGPRCSKPVGTTAWCPADLVPGTPCASRPGCPSMATSSTVRPRPSKRAWAGPSSWTATSSAAMRSPRTSLAQQLVGLVLRGRGIARQGYPVAHPGEAEPVGVVTSGSQSPTSRRGHRHGPCSAH